MTGCPNLLTTGGPVALDRVLADGLPADYPAEAALLDALDRAHLAYDVTTDLVGDPRDRPGARLRIPA